MSKLDVAVGYAAPRKGVPASASFRRWIEAALKGARRRKATEVSVRIVDAEEGQALNLQYRGRDYATNVLSFPVELPPGVDLPLIGDLVICAPVVAREAADNAADHLSLVVADGRHDLVRVEALHGGIVEGFHTRHQGLQHFPVGVGLQCEFQGALP